LDDAARVARGLDGVTEAERRGNRAWSVNGKAIAWERTFSKADVKRFGSDPIPGGAILAVSVADLSEKEAVLAEHAPAVFTIAHFDGYPAVLVRLEIVPEPVLDELITDAWRFRR
jgi:hypothetical protein